jgi:alpha-tubulin suppressor-like RCC1 family protein
LIRRLRNSVEGERETKIAIESQLEAKHREIADLEERGPVYVAGKNAAGQLGLGTT